MSVLSTLQSLYEQALRQQKSGNLPAAERLYREILQQDPRHADALHFLGVIAYQAGHHQEAIRLIAAATGLNRAKASYHSNLGLAYQAVRNLDDAAACFEEALRLRPDNPIAHNNLGVIRLEQGRAEEAAQCFQQAKRFNDQDAEAYNNLGKALRAQGKLDQAIACHQQALQLRPDFAEAQLQLGIAYREQGDLEQAVRQFLAAIKLDPTSAEAHNNLGACYTKLKRLDEAENALRKAVQLEPENASAHSNLGVALLEQGRHAEAKQCIEEALRLRPDAAGARSNLGAVYLQLGQVEEALRHVEEALRIQPDNIDAHWNRSLIWLSLGRFREGWLEYEWRMLRPESRGRRLPRPLWDGSDLEGKTILLHCEQGLGDTIQFCRYASLVAERGGKVVLACQRPLVPLLSQCTTIESVVAKESGMLQFDLHAPLMSLPGIFRSDEDGIPREVPYIRADPELVSWWRDRLPASNRMRIGIAWQGNKTFPGDHYRSLPLRHFAALADIPGVELISLQKGEGSEQLHTVDFKVRVLEAFDEEHGPFMDTAAIMRSLDLVITSDTVIPHLAGATATPVWLLLSAAADWRWLLMRNDSPWYRSMTIFRQTQLNDWAELFGRVASELRFMVERRDSSS